MEERKCLEWNYYDFPVHPDKNRVYCRMANRVMIFDSTRCFHCPLWNGDCREVHCAYYGPMLESELSPYAVKKLMDGLIAAEYDSEFPTILKADTFNFAGRVTPEKWSFGERLKIEKAYQFAAMAHKGQVRKGTKTPYIVHPVETSLIAFEMTNDISIIIGAILHDVVEDTNYELDDIEHLFGDEVAKLVSYESEDKRKDLLPEDSWKIRKQEFLTHLELAPVGAKVITLADKLSNMRAIAKDYELNGDDIWKRFNQKNKREHEWYYRGIADLTKELSGTESYREYLELCDKIFVNK